MFPYEFCEIFKITNSVEHPRANALPILIKYWKAIWVKSNPYAEQMKGESIPGFKRSVQIFELSCFFNIFILMLAQYLKWNHLRSYSNTEYNEKKKKMLRLKELSVICIKKFRSVDLGLSQNLLPKVTFRHSKISYEEFIKTLCQRWS